MLVILISTQHVSAQLMPANGLPMGIGGNRSGMLNDSMKSGDSSKLKKNKWKDEQAKIYYKHIHSEKKLFIDTSLHLFHHYQTTQPWWGADLGNAFSPATNLFFSPYQQSGPSLGFHIWDLYQYSLDSLRMYNTTRPYSDFKFSLGSKAEQIVDVLHTQNINPRWNVAGRIRNVNSPGFFYTQKSTNVSGSLSSNYSSKNDRYRMMVGFINNRFSLDENGGIKADSFLTASGFPDRLMIPVKLPESLPGSQRSAVTNRLRNTDFLLQNAYAWGQRDTLYNEDSTKATVHFTPRFQLKHQLHIHSEKHTFQDVNPDSVRYANVVSRKFSTADTIKAIQGWNYVDNKFSLNGFIGKKDNLLAGSAGIGFRYDNFRHRLAPNPAIERFLSSYVFGEIKKEAHAEGEWEYGAKADFYFLGKAVGNFNLDAIAGKSFKNIGNIRAGFQQTLSNTPYAYTNFNSNFFARSFVFEKTSYTRVWGQIEVPRIHLQAGVQNYIIGNYLYYTKDGSPTQQSTPFSVLQVYGRKQFNYKILSLDNEVVWQQPTANAPINVPAIMLRHVLSIEADMFKKALRVSTGIEARYRTPYFVGGYSPYYNQFYFQDSIRISNPVELTAFFNFKVKSFRCFVSGDQLQQLFIRRNVINFVNYPAQNALIRFGFSWVMIN